jgi:hypothetical protein
LITDDLQKEWDKKSTTPSDMWLLMPRLRDLAREHRRILELGLWNGKSTTALLMGEPDRMLSIDIDVLPETRWLLECAPGILEIRQQDSRCEIDEEFDLLFIDSEHTAEVCSVELELHHPRITRTIAFHDTVTCPDLWNAIGPFLAAHTDWYLDEHISNCNGLSILRRGRPEGVSFE